MLKKVISNDEVLMFLHVPKTAGTRLRSIIAEQYNNDQIAFIYNDPKVGISGEQYRSLTKDQLDRIKIVYGHYHFGAHRTIHKSWSYAAFLRDPVDRVISYYCHQTRDKASFSQIIRNRNYSLEEFVERRVSKETSNHMVRIFSDCNTYSCIGKDLKIAKQRVSKHFSFIGFTEHFEDDMINLSKSLGWNRGDIQSPNYFTKKENVSDNPITKSNLSSRAISIIYNHNQLDAELYEHAYKMFR